MDRYDFVLGVVALFVFLLSFAASESREENCAAEIKQYMEAQEAARENDNG